MLSKNEKEVVKKTFEFFYIWYGIQFVIIIIPVTLFHKMFILAPDMFRDFTIFIGRFIPINKIIFSSFLLVQVMIIYSIYLRKNINIKMDISKINYKKLGFAYKHERTPSSVLYLSTVISSNFSALLIALMGLLVFFITCNLYILYGFTLIYFTMLIALRPKYKEFEHFLIKMRTIDTEYINSLKLLDKKKILSDLDKAKFRWKLFGVIFLTQLILSFISVKLSSIIFLIAVLCTFEDNISSQIWKDLKNKYNINAIEILIHVAFATISAFIFNTFLTFMVK